ncbi:MAG TPA: phospholipase D-like domain-containing protein, partial [Chitinophagales bacterium]|nr:phospholipase D-like domain-containing protein [Chitinophagales bacterium]
MKHLLLFVFIACSLFSRAQIAQGKIKIYFNHPVNTAVSSGVNASYVSNALDDTLINYINRAKHSIDIAQYDYTSPSSIATAVNNAYSRGVTIRWVYDGSSPNSSLSQLNANIHTLASPTSSSYGIMHHKYVIFDAASADSTDAIVWTGSADWSNDQVNKDYNNIIILQSQALAQAYTAEFNQMWGSTTATPNQANSKFGPYKTHVNTGPFVIGGVTVELFFSPTDSVNNHILNAINSANSQLFF